MKIISKTIVACITDVLTVFYMLATLILSALLRGLGTVLCILTTLIVSALIRGIGQVLLALGLVLLTSSNNIASMFLSQIQRSKLSFTKAD